MAQFNLNQDDVVVIVGSGAGGGTMANELAQRGVKCVVLEAGQRFESSEFKNDELEMFNKTSWLDERTMSGNASTVKNRAMPAWLCKTVGGTTFHWAGCSLRFKDFEFKAASAYGDVPGATLLDWPITLDDLVPYYERAQDKMGVTGTHDIPYLPANNNAKVLAEGARRIGYEEYSTGHMAINSRPRDGRAGCMQLGFCYQGCKSQAKWSTLYTEIPKAEATGNMELRTGCAVLKIEHDEAGKVTGVTYADPNGQHQTQKARAVCVAANSIETPRLLLNSKSELFPDGLANRSGHVGRHYTVHATSSVFAIFDNPVYMNRGTVMAGLVEDEAIHDPSRGFAGGYHMETIALGLLTTAALVKPGAWGQAFAEMMENYKNMAGVWLCGEDMPMATNRITLHPSHRDANGLPTPHIHIDDHPNDIAMVGHAVKQATALYESVGAKKIIEVPAYPAGHNMGTSRMSAKPEDGVVNKWGQTHDIENLFISDGSVFTTGGSPNPTLTIVGLAMRQAEFIANRIRNGEL